MFLKFIYFIKYEETNDTLCLKALKIRPIRMPIDALAHHDENIEENGSFENVIVNNKIIDLKIVQNENDSDDDLIPYDLSNDIVTGTKGPAYLKDCLDILVNSDDPEKIEASLKAVQPLCKSYHSELNEVSL